jgi:hypothetical protein
MSRPEWMVPGADVAVIHVRIGGNTVTFGRIDRVLKRDVVLEDGTRFNADSRSSKVDGWAWDKLEPVDAPQVQRAVSDQGFRARRSELRGLLDAAVRKAAKSRDSGELYGVAFALVGELEHLLDGFRSSVRRAAGEAFADVVVPADDELAEVPEVEDDG